MSEELLGANLIEEKNIPLLVADDTIKATDPTGEEDHIILELGTGSNSEEVLSCYNYDTDFGRLPEDLVKTYTNLDDVVTSSYNLNNEDSLPALSAVIYDLENYDSIQELTNSLSSVDGDLSRDQKLPDQTPIDSSTANVPDPSFLANLYQTSTINVDNIKMPLSYSTPATKLLDTEPVYSLPVVSEFISKLDTPVITCSSRYSEQDAALNPLSLESQSGKKSEVVPPPVYVPYLNMPEHPIVKESNPSWKERVLQSEKGS